MFKIHATFTSARVTTAEARLAHRRGGVNNYNQPNCAPNGANQPQAKPQEQKQMANGPSYKLDMDLTRYAAGNKNRFLNRMQKIREKAAEKGAALSQLDKDRVANLDTYFNGSFKTWIEKYEQKLQNNAVELEKTLKNCENYIDDIEKRVYGTEQLPQGKSFNERGSEWAVDYALKNGIAVYTYGTDPNNCVIDVPRGWDFTFENAKILPITVENKQQQTFDISGGRKRIAFMKTPNTSIKVTTDGVTAALAINGGTISVAPLLAAIAERDLERAKANEKRNEDEARSKIDVQAGKVDEAIDEEEKFRTPRDADNNPVRPLDQIPAAAARKEAAEVQNGQKILEENKGNLSKPEYDRQKEGWDMREREANRRVSVFTLQEAVRAFREDRPEDGKKLMAEVAAKFEKTYGVYDDKAEDVFEMDNISQLSAEDGYQPRGGGVDRGEGVPRAKDAQPYKLVYKGKGTFDVKENGNYKGKVNATIDKRNREVAFKELRRALSEALKLDITDADIEGVITAMGKEAPVYLNKKGQLMEQYSVVGDKNLEEIANWTGINKNTTSALTFAELMKKDELAALQRLTRLPSTNAAPNKLKVAAEAAIKRYNETRELRYEELAPNLALLKNDVDGVRQMKLYDAKGVSQRLNYMLKKLKLVQPGINPKGRPNLGEFPGRIQSALGNEPIDLPNGTQVRVVYDDASHSVITVPVTVEVQPAEPTKKPRSTPYTAEEDVASELEEKMRKQIDIDATRSVERFNESVKEQLEVAEILSKHLPDAMVNPGAGGKTLEVSGVAAEPLTEALQKLNTETGKKHTFKADTDTDSWIVSSD